MRDPYKIPSLDALADRSELVLDLPPAARAAVLLRVAALLTAISAGHATEAALHRGAAQPRRSGPRIGRRP